MDFAVFVFMCTNLAILSTNAGLGYAKISKALLKKTGGYVKE